MEYVVDCVEFAHDAGRVWRKSGGSWLLAVPAAVNGCVKATLVTRREWIVWEELVVVLWE